MSDASLINSTHGKPISDCVEGQKLGLDPATPGIFVETICQKTGEKVSIVITGAGEGQKISCEMCPLPPTARR